MGAGMMVTGQCKVPTDPANNSKRRRLLERETHKGLHKTRTKYVTRKEGVFMEKYTTGELINQGNPRSSSQMSFSIQLVQNVSSMQRMLAHVATQWERQQNEFTRVLDNFQRVGQSRTQTMLEEEEKINQLQDREIHATA